MQSKRSVRLYPRGTPLSKVPVEFRGCTYDEWQAQAAVLNIAPPAKALAATAKPVFGGKRKIA